MPLIIKNQPAPKVTKEKVERYEKVSARAKELSAAVVEKRKKKTAKRRERYSLKRKEREPAEFDTIKVMVDGEEKQLSQGSKFLLDMLIKD